MSEYEKKKDDIENMLKMDIYQKFGQKPVVEQKKFTQIMTRAYEKKEVRNNSRNGQFQTVPTKVNIVERKSSVVVRPSSKLGLSTVDKKENKILLKRPVSAKN